MSAQPSGWMIVAVVLLLMALARPTITSWLRKGGRSDRDSVVDAWLIVALLGVAIGSQLHALGWRLF